MRKFFFLALAAILLAGCSNEREDETINSQKVVLTFSPYEMTAMTRAALTSSVASRLDVWLVEGSNTTDIHQASTDEDFGTLSVVLNKTKTYTLYAMAHKGDGAATLSDGVISFPDDKVKDTFWYTTTFTPSTTTSINAAMTRIVAQFRLMITDDIPEEVKKVRITLSDVFDRWNVSTGWTHGLDRVSTISYGGTSSNFSVFAIVTDAQTTHTVTVDALDNDDAVVKSRTFEDVPLRNGYKTQYQGVFFTDVSTSATFTVSDWSEYDTVNF